MTDLTDEPTMRTQIVQAAHALFAADVMSHTGHANLSARLGPDRFLLTTSGLVRDLSVEDLAVLDLDGQVVSGELSPENAEIIAMHSVVYRARGDVHGIIHTHSPAVTAFALAHEPLPCRYEGLLRFGQAEATPVVEWGPRGSEISVRGIARVLGEAPTTQAVLLANHGLLAFGGDPLGAARLVIALEEAAEAELAARALGGAVDFPPDALAKVRESMARVRV